MAKEPAGPRGHAGSEDWESRLNALTEHLLGLESELQQIHDGLRQLRSDVKHRGEADRQVPLSSPSEPTRQLPPPPSPDLTKPTPPVEYLPPVAIPPASPPPPVSPVPPTTLPPVSQAPAILVPSVEDAPAATPPTTPAAPVSHAAPTTVRPAQATPPPAVSAPGRRGPSTPAEREVLSARSGKSAAPAEPHAAGGISNLEAKIGGAWLSRAAALFMLLGAAWFFKYAVDQHWISPWMRVSVGWAASALLLALGERTSRRQMPWFAASVTGAGLGLAYIASYSASPQFYGLLSLTASYAVFSVITVLGLLQAVRLAQLAIAIFALVGGYMTLVLLPSPHPTAAGLLGYLIALNVGALGAGQLRSWPVLRYLTWPASAILIGMYLGTTHRPGTELGVCLSLLPALFVMFQLDVFFWRLRRPDVSPHFASLLSGLNCAGILLAVWATVSRDQVDHIVGTAFFAVAAFQVILARVLWILSSTDGNRHLSISFYGQASTAAALGFPIAFDRSAIVLGWSAQALTIAWLVRHVRSIVLRAKVPVLLAAAIVYIVYFFDQPYMLEGRAAAGFHFVTRMWLAGAIALAGGVTAWLFGRWYAQSTWWLERSLGEVCAALATISGVIAGATLLSPTPQALQWVCVTMAGGLCLGLLSYSAKVLRLPALMAMALIAAAVLIVHDMSLDFGAVFQGQPWKVGPVDCGDLLPVGLVLSALAFWNAWLLRHAATTRYLPADPAEWLAAAATAATCLVLWHQFGDDSPAYAVIAGTLAALVLTGVAWRWTPPAFGIWSAVTWSIAAIYWICIATIGQRSDASGHVSGAWVSVPPFANATFFSALGLIAAAWLITRRLKTSAALLERGQVLLRSVPAVLTAYIVIHAVSYEVDRWFQISGASWFARPEYIESVTLTALWAAFALVYIGSGLRVSLRSLGTFGLVVLSVAAVKLLAWDTIILRTAEEHGNPWFWTTMVPLANPTFLAALLIGAAAWVARIALQRATTWTLEAREHTRALLLLIPAYILLHVFSFEVDRWFQIHGASQFASPDYVESTTLTAVWAAFALLYLLVSLRSARQPLWWLSLVIATVSTVKLVAADTLMRRFGEGSASLETWATLPAFVNPTLACFVLLAIIAFTTMATLRRLAWVGPEQRQTLESFLPVVAAYLLIHVLSFEVDRWFQAGGSARFDDPAHAERVALSVLWACCALTCVVSGLTFSIRPLRLFGLLVFAITAGKVLLRDMANVLPVYRALSAFGLGVLALGGSYAYQRVRRRTSSVEGARGMSGSDQPPSAS